MGSEFTFYDYVVDEKNFIEEWLDNEVPEQVRAKFKNWLLHLEATKPGQWQRPLVDTLTDDCAGFFEIRAKLAKNQYRILGCHGPGERKPTLLYGFMKPGNKVPQWACNEANLRKERVLSDDQKPDQYRKPHNYEHE